MSDTFEAELDWDHLPPGLAPLSLWRCLHDAYLTCCRSHLRERSLVLEFRSVHLKAHFNLPADWRFQFHFSKVQSLAVEASSHGREESISWSAFELALAADDCEFSVLEAHLIQQGERGVALRLGGKLDGDEWHQLTLQADALTVTRSDADSFSLEGLLALGEAYWDEFSQRRPTA